MPPQRVDTGGNIIVLGVDPGTLVTGYGIVRRSGNRLTLISCGAIRCRSSLPLPVRLEHIYTNLSDVMMTHHPNEFAIESAFYGKNAQSALKLGHARGVSLLAAVQQKLPTAEYSPREIKKAVTGNGNASKDQISFMVRSILGIADRKMGTDTSDAIAVAVCHIQRLTTPGVRFKNWETFFQTHPEKLSR